MLLCMLYTQNRSRKVVQLCPQQASLPVGIGLLASRCLALHRSLGCWSKYLQCLILFKSLWQKWIDGNYNLHSLLQSQADPSEIMMEVLKALRELDIVWKSIGAYSVRCRWIPPLPNLNKSCNWSAGNSFSESPMTLGSFPSSEMSLTANGIMLDDSELQDQFLVRFEAQVCQIKQLLSLPLFWQSIHWTSKMFCSSVQFLSWRQLLQPFLTFHWGDCSFSRQGMGSICWICNKSVAPIFCFLSSVLPSLQRLGQSDMMSAAVSLFSITNQLLIQPTGKFSTQSLNRYGYGCVHCFRTFISILNKPWFTAVQHSWCRILEGKRIGLPQTSFLHTL